MEIIYVFKEGEVMNGFGRLLNTITEKTYVIRILMLLIASSVFFIAYLFIETNDNLEYQNSILKQQKRAYLKESIEAISKEAKTDARITAANINHQLSLAYPINEKGSQDRMETDLQKYISGDLEVTPLAGILYKNTYGQHFNIDNDNNDPFIVSVVYDKVNGLFVRKIIFTSDYSINCLTPNPRTLEEEINNKQFAKGLVTPAIIDIIENNKPMTIWHFVTPSNDDPSKDIIRNLNYMDTEKLLDMVDTYGIGIIDGFEFLQAVRLNDTQDLAGRDIVVSGSRLNTSAQSLFYFNNFNFTDQLAFHEGMREKLSSFDKEATSNVREANNKKRIYLLFLALDTILVLISTYALDKRR